MPVISNPQGASANDPDLELDTSNTAVPPKDVRSRIPPPRPIALEPFCALKNWEGVVTAVENSVFFASMRLTSSDSKVADAEFEIDMDNVPEGDRDLVRDGAVFYLTVGIRHPLGEKSQKTTRIVFRRMPRWSDRDIERAESAATDLWQRLQPGSDK